MKDFSLEQMRTFVLVVERGGFSAAAAYLNLTQPAVSAQIRELERRLGVRLVERLGRRVAPTAAGRELLAHARAIEDQVAAALQAVEGASQGIWGRVRIGVGATACIHVLPPLLKDLRRRFPDLEIAVGTGNTLDVLRAIEENAFDVGLVTLPAPGRIFQVTPVLDDEMVVIGPPGAGAPPAVAPPAWLAEAPLILYESRGHTRRILDERLGRENLPLRPVMELGNIEAIKELVAAGLGFGIVPRMAVAGAISRGEIAAASLAPPLFRTLAVVLRRDKPLSRGLRETVRVLESLAGPRGQ